MSTENVTVKVGRRELKAKARVAIRSKEVGGKEGIVAYLTSVEAPRQQYRYKSAGYAGN